ncbi:PP2C family serine/threonine-protein phosphatase [Aspergillus fischeri NRRL 181]|uniref:Protein phosphatase 2C family protein n=1 Tax=Neosartorya fischeri (strain ATCC 1020 / DSM 3700 / CBS 544.65 / FGSC A1164 / JCM 1740 / NRRL 181 / WB 181) TaxID=331117 RepID=A1DDF0_NEOFI|nr:protein phosphatase 2C family protein [Aspergillus fischeri NRRL 181]EAW17407.1 protein phosphatase 2C family protein [Aspergillus fischeri NRRL 181]
MGPLSSSASGDKLTLKDAGGNSAPGSRPSQQDQYTILLPAQIPFKTEKTLLFLGVYDGHVTSDVSLHAKQHLHRLILESPDIQTGNYEKAIEDAVQKEDNLLLDQFKAGNEVFGKSGSTFSVCLVDLTDGILVVGNLGDSHVLLAEHHPNGWEMKRITKAHKPGSDAEKERIKEAGGVVNRELGSPRIGALNMSRALGDLQYKAPLINADEPFSLEQEIAGFNPEKEQGDLLSNRPAISRIELEEDRKYIVILTTDGVTDEMEDRRILDRVVAHWNYGTRAEGVAGKITTEATGGPMSDNATCVCAFIYGRQHDSA